MLDYITAIQIITKLPDLDHERLTCAAIIQQM